MGAAMFIMHVDRHFPSWTTYSCSFRQTVPQKNQKKYLTQIFTWKFPWWSCAGVFVVFVVKTSKNVYYFSMHTGGNTDHLTSVSTCSPQCWAPRCEKRHLHPPQGFDRRCARPWWMVIRLRGESGSIPLEVFEWVSLQGVYEGVVWLFYIPGAARFLPFNSILISTNTTDPFHQGTRTGVPLTVYLWYLAGVLGWNSWGWP